MYRPIVAYVISEWKCGCHVNDNGLIQPDTLFDIPETSHDT